MSSQRGKSPDPNANVANDGDPADEMTASPGKLLRRSEAARLLGVSTSTLRRMEGTALRPELGPDGVHRFREEHVRELVIHRNSPAPPDAYDGATAAAVFGLLDDGVHPVDIVKQLSLDPRAVEAMHRQWASMRDSFLVMGQEARAIEQLPWLGGSRPIRDGRELLANLGSTNPEFCAKCQDEYANLCVKCAKTMGAREIGQREVEARGRRDEQERQRRKGEWEREFLPRPRRRQDQRKA